MSAPSTEFIHYGKWWLRVGRWIALVITLVALCLAYLWIAGLLIAQTNFTDRDILGADQKHNIKLALQTREDLSLDFTRGFSQPIKDWFPHRTDGVVNPLWPWVAAWLADDSHPISGEREVTEQDRMLFNRGRWFHVSMTMGFLVLLGVTCARFCSLPATFNIVMLAGFGALLPRAVYFQPEPIYFIFFLLTWVCCIFALRRNSLWVYGAIGVLSGIAWLAKGSTDPLLAVFVGVSTLRWAWGWVLARWPGHSTTLWVRRNHFFGLFLLVTCHFMTVGPRLAYAAEKFGNPRHSYPAYWMWFDNFEDCYRWMGEHGTREALQNIPESEKPSFANYAATHTNEQMITRLVAGTKTKLREFLWPGHTTGSRTPKPWKGVLELRGVYLAGLAGILLALMAAVSFSAPKAHHAGQRLHPETAAIVLFVLGSFAAYALAYGWYTPIGRGDRFMLSLYAPLVLSIVWASEAIVRRARRRKAGRWIFTGYHAAHWLLFAAMTWRIIEILRFPYFRN